LVYADDVRVHITERNMKVLVVASKEVGLEVKCGKTKYMVLSQDMNENEVTIWRLIIAPWERVKELKYLETTLTDQNSLQKEINSRLTSGKACYHSAESFVLQVAI